MNITVDNIDDLDLSKTYTYADYYSWRFEERVELIRGKVFKMVNYPGAFCIGTNHQIISGNIAFRLWIFCVKVTGPQMFLPLRLMFV